MVLASLHARFSLLLGLTLVLIAQKPLVYAEVLLCHQNLHDFVFCLTDPIASDCVAKCAFSGEGTVTCNRGGGHDTWEEEVELCKLFVNETAPNTSDVMLYSRSPGLYT